MGKDKKCESNRKKTPKKHSSGSSSEDKFERKVKKELKRLKKKRKEKKRSSKDKVKKEKTGKVAGTKTRDEEKSKDTEESYDINISLMSNSEAFVPMTKEQWEKQQSILRRVYDEASGRTRLIRGTGEIVEECVSRDRHLAINKQATQGDGEYFQKTINKNK